MNLSDSEFARLKESIITSDVFAASKNLREINTFKRDDDTPLQYTLVNIKDWCKNEFEVVNQLRMNTINSNHRYDVIILINGIPVVQVELKTLHINPKKAMEQIVEYKNDPGNGYTNSLLCFMQIFIVSNESSTYYFANNSNEHFCFNADERFLPIYELAKENNEKVKNLREFSDMFLPKCTLGQLINKYMVLVASEQKLMIMRPYQIYAVKAIVDCIEQNRGNGYIWHTTGSGKTLTSFKASTLLKDNPEIEKCLFVVDRKDLDRQTRMEFNKFQDGCVEENTNTQNLVRRLESTDYRDKVIVTTMQKLGIALSEDSKHNKDKKEKGKLTFKDRLSKLRDKRLVIIFDECHRSQFGDYHDLIKEFFPKAQLFGFTGTPIFDENSTYTQISDSNEGVQKASKTYKTTKDVFQKDLHSYTITNAIDDGNVLCFHIDYYKPNDDKKALNASTMLTKEAIVKSILAKHNAATNYRRFNALFATSSINDAIAYYDLFKTIQEEMSEENSEYEKLNIACVFSPPAEGDKDIKQIQQDLDQEKIDNEKEPAKKKKALQDIMHDYNTRYGTYHIVSEFDLYYQGIQQRIKDQKYTKADYPQKNKVDITIVVDMLLTGFDSKYLNTLYVDKNLKYHGLIQAFSRTNRILNDTKPYGNIIDYKGLEEEVDKAIALFSGENITKKPKEIWLVDTAPVVVAKLDKAVEELENFMQSNGLDCKPEQVANLKGEIAKCEFIKKFKEVQRLKTQLDQYTDIKEEYSKKIEELFPENTLQAFRGVYLETAQELKALQGKSVESSSEEVEQLDFEFVLFSSALVDYDYIMSLISKYTQNNSKTKKQAMSKAQLIDLLCSTSNLMEEREEIAAYIDTLEVGKPLSEDEVKNGYHKFRQEKLAKEIEKVATQFLLTHKSLQSFIDDIIKFMRFEGEKLNDLLEPLNLGWRDRTKKELELMDVLMPILKKIARGQEIVGLNAYEQ